MLFPLVFPKIELVPADPDVCPLGPQLWQEGSDLLGVEFVGAVAEEGTDLVVTRGPDPVDCPQPGRVWKTRKYQVKIKGGVLHFFVNSEAEKTQFW